MEPVSPVFCALKASKIFLLFRISFFMLPKAKVRRSTPLRNIPTLPPPPHPPPPPFPPQGRPWRERKLTPFSCCSHPRFLATLSAMTRAKVVAAILLTVSLGFLVGWWLFGMPAEPVVRPVTHEAAASSARPRVLSGFCCLTMGEACDEVANPAECFAQNGNGFNSRKATCDNFCVKIGSLQR